MNKLFASSVNSDEVSLTVKSALGYAAGLGIILAGAFGATNVDQELVSQLIDVLTQIVGVFMQLVSLVGVAWGLIRKFLPRNPQVSQ